MIQFLYRFNKNYFFSFHLSSTVFNWNFEFSFIIYLNILYLYNRKIYSMCRNKFQPVLKKVTATINSASSEWNVNFYTDSIAESHYRLTTSTCHLSRQLIPKVRNLLKSDTRSLWKFFKFNFWCKQNCRISVKSPWNRNKQKIWAV